MDDEEFNRKLQELTDMMKAHHRIKDRSMSKDLRYEIRKLFKDLLN